MHMHTRRRICAHKQTHANVQWFRKLSCGNVCREADQQEDTGTHSCTSPVLTLILHIFLDCFKNNFDPITQERLWIFFFGQSVSLVCWLKHNISCAALGSSLGQNLRTKGRKWGCVQDKVRAKLVLFSISLLYYDWLTVTDTGLKHWTFFSPPNFCVSKTLVRIFRSTSLCQAGWFDFFYLFRTWK